MGTIPARNGHPETESSARKLPVTIKHLNDLQKITNGLSGPEKKVPLKISPLIVTGPRTQRVKHMTKTTKTSQVN